MNVKVQEIFIGSKPDCPFYLKLEWDRDLGTGFVVLLCDGVSAWSGEVSEEDISKEAQEIGMPRESYVDELRLMLTGELQANQNYSFHVDSKHPGSPILQLCYEKVQSKMSFRYGTVELVPMPEPTKVIRELISYGIERSASLQASRNNMQKENQILRNKLDNINAEMEGYIKEKETLERELYSRFVLILNEKKGRICTLQERLRQLQDEKQSCKRGEEFQRETEQADEKHDDSDYAKTTDEEEDEDLQNPHQRPSHRGLANSKVDYSHDDIADVAPSRKRRQRGFQPESQRPPVEQRQSLRSALVEEVKQDVRKVEQPPRVSPDPDDLFDDI